MLKTFNGFPPEAIQFFQDLALNNNKPWFEANRELFEDKVLAPARAFVGEMGARLRAIAPEIVADPRIDKAIFRLHRDVRFSPDKSPYKKHLAIFMWEGKRKKIENSGFYLQVNSDSIEIGGGIYIFPKDVLPAYREAVVHSLHGDTLAKIAKDIRQNGKLQMCEADYKKVPRGVDPAHPNAEFLRFNGLFAMAHRDLPPELHTEKFVDYCFDFFQEISALHAWARDLIERTGDR